MVRRRRTLHAVAATLLVCSSAYSIAPGQTKRYRVWEGNTDRHYTSTNGLRAFEVWVPDGQTVVQATWYEETRGGHQWVRRGSERVSGKNRRFSRTVYLRPTENFRLEVKGIHSSKGKRKICYYYVRCVDNPFSHVVTYNSRNLLDLDTWFIAGPYQRWYWAGCACWVVANPRDKEILLLDGYVSKATVGGNRNYGCGKTERKRVVRFVNQLRYFVSRGYRVVGVLISHEHGDHVGDVPYILGGLRAANSRDFMKTGVALTGRAQREATTVVCSAEAVNDGYFAKSGYDSNYHRLTRSNVSIPVFDGDTKTEGRGFTVGRPYHLGHFCATPYIWDHGKVADGGVGGTGGRRTLAYRIWRRDARDTAKVFFTSGFIEERGFLRSVNRTISCHHLIFAWHGHDLTGESAKKVTLLPDSPVRYNYIFTNHMDNNSNAGDMDDSREEVIDMLGMFLDKGVIEHNFQSLTDRVIWGGQERRIRLGAFKNRLGVD